MGDEFGNEASRARHEVPRRKRDKLVSSVRSLLFVRSHCLQRFCGALVYDGLLDSTVQKQRRCAVLIVKFNYNQ